MMYLGNFHAIDMVKDFLENFGEIDQKGLILTGKPGLGKTHLTYHISEKLGLFRYIFNSSDKRSKMDIRKIYNITQLKDRCLVVLDECEGVKTKDLIGLLKHTKQPIIMCCNFIDEIDREVIEKCIVVKLEKPPWWIFRDYMKQLYLDSPVEDQKHLNLDNIDSLAKKCISFRHAQSLIEDPTDEGYMLMLSEIEEIQLSLSGKAISRFKMKPDELIHWINDNSSEPDAISIANIFLERAYSHSYHFQKYAYAILGNIRSTKQVRYPRSFIARSKAKKASTPEPESKKQADTKEQILDMTESDLATILDDIELEDALIQDSSIDDDKNEGVTEWY